MFLFTFVLSEIFLGRYEDPARLKGIGIVKSFMAAGNDVRDVDKLELSSRDLKSSLLELKFTDFTAEAVLPKPEYLNDLSGMAFVPLPKTSRTASRNFIKSCARLFCPLCS